VKAAAFNRANIGEDMGLNWFPAVNNVANPKLSITIVSPRPNFISSVKSRRSHRLIAAITALLYFHHLLNDG